MLLYSLHKHPEIVALGEMYNPDYVLGHPGAEWMDRSFLLEKIRNKFPFFFLRHYIYRTYHSRKRAVGFKVFYHHFDAYERVRDYIAGHKDIKVIHLKRKNLLHQYASHMVAIRTNQWVLSPGDSKGDNVTIPLSYDDCLDRFIYSVKTRKFFSTLFKDHDTLDVYYEDMVENFTREISRVLNFLKVSPRRLTTASVKQNTLPISKIVLNYEELRKKFQYTRWKSLFQ